MSMKQFGWRTELTFLLLLFSVSCFLFLCNLGNQYLWDDEAETALVGKTILSHGFPLAYDGRNYFSQLGGDDYAGNYIWKLHPWLQFYVAAGFLGLFGTTTFAARLPFALFGIASVFLTYTFCKTLWQSRKIAAIAAFLMLTSVPFLLLSRQCRYHSMTAFFSLAGLYLYLGVIKQEKYAPLAFFLSLVLLFHTQYIYCFTLLAAVSVHCLLFYRRRLAAVLLLSAAVLIVNFAWISWLLGAKIPPPIGGGLFSFDRLIWYSSTYLKQIAESLFPPLLLLIVPAVLVFRKKRTGTFKIHDRPFLDKLLLLLFYILFTLTALILKSPTPSFRYLSPLVPIFVILTALLIFAAGRIHPFLAVGIIVVLVLSGSFKDFLYEITHDYDGPIEGIVKFLKENAGKDDVVAITYGDLPVKFYTDMRVIGGLTGEDFAPARQARWVIVRRNTYTKADAKFGNYLMSFLNPADYELIMIDYPDIPWENREEPSLHHFRTVKEGDKVVMFKKKKK